MSALLIIHIRLFPCFLLSLCVSLLPTKRCLLVCVHTGIHSASLMNMNSHASNYRLEAERLWFGLNWWKSTSPPPLHPSFSISVPPLPGWRFTPARPRKDGSLSLRTSAWRSELVKAAACNSIPPLTRLSPSFNRCGGRATQRVSVETL